MIEKLTVIVPFLVNATQKDGIDIIKDASVSADVLLQTSSADDEAGLRIQLFLPKLAAERIVDGLEAGGGALYVENVPTPGE